MNLDLFLQPKQGALLDLVEQTNGATWIGLGGGRGGSKSAALQRVMIARRLQIPGTIGCMLMRNSDQIQRYHEDVIIRTWPSLDACYLKTKRKIVIPFRDGKASEIQFSYAESLEDVIRRFRSANYHDIFIDQAEQFTENELREIRQAVRWPGVPDGTCKLVLAFNMGGAGISFLRKKFHTLEYGPREKRENFAFIHVGPYDNVEWVRPALEADGLSPEVYYSWGEARRKEYCGQRSDYGQTLMSQDDALVKRDFEGSWDSLEGSFFGRSYDRDATVLTPEQTALLVRPWWQKWLAQDWGRGHYCPTYWNASGELSPKDAEKLLGWSISFPIKVVVTYREHIAGGAAEPDGGGTRELAEKDIARRLIERTPDVEREHLKDFFLSPDAFAKRQESVNTIAFEIGAVMSAAYMPEPRKADDDRVNGWALMSNLLLSSKRKGAKGDVAWLISANCPELISAIPLAMRDPKNLDDVLKTDKGQAKLEQDCLDAARYALKSMLEPGHKPREEEIQNKLREMAEQGLDQHSLMIHSWRLNNETPRDDAPVYMGRRHQTIIRR